MRSWLQTVVLLLVVVAVVSGLTYLLHFSISPGPDKAAVAPTLGAKQAPSPQLTLPVKVVESAGEFEVHVPGHQNFWFYNAEKVPIHIGLFEKNCVCSGVNLAVLTPREAQQFVLRPAATHVLLAGAWQPVLGSDPALLAGHVWECARLDRQVVPSSGWQPLEKGGAPVTVAPGAVGLVQLIWKGEEEKPFRLSADLWNQTAENSGGARSQHRLEVALAFVQPVRIYPQVADLGDIHPGGTAEAEFVCWSSTRPQFTLQPKEKDLHPCFEIALTPLTAADKARWASTLGTRIQSGWTVKVRAHERRSDKVQLDIGPLRGTITLVSDAANSPLALNLKGEVRGEVALLGSAQRNRLALGNFRARAGVRRDFILVSEKPGIELLEEVTVEPPGLEYLIVKVRKDDEASTGSRTQWNLSVEVPPARAAGALPRASAVLLKIKGDPPRRIRIPVTGTAFN